MRLPVDALDGVPCCSPAERDPASVLAWSEARLEEAGREGASLALWLPAGTTVAIGLAQKPEVELEVDALRRDGVGLLRRQSGGGAVLLYAGVMCWEAWADVAEIERMRPGGSGIRQSYEVMAHPVSEGLRRLGVDVFHAGICDISAASPHGGAARKLAGLAQRRWRERVLVHGSLLVSPDVSMLARYLKFPSEVPDYRAGRGHDEFCATVLGMLGGEGDPAGFMRRVAGAVASAALADGWEVLTPPAILDATAERLYREKYLSREWNWEKIRPR